MKIFAFGFILLLAALSPMNADAAWSCKAPRPFLKSFTNFLATYSGAGEDRIEAFNAMVEQCTERRCNAGRLIGYAVCPTRAAAKAMCYSNVVTLTFACVED